MRITVGSEFAWTLAAHEAIIGHFAEIEPEHLLMALLKLPDMPRGELNKACKSKALEAVLATNIEELQKDLEKLGLECTRVRRELRTRMGKGDRPNEKRQVSPSQASRDLLEHAEHLAEAASAKAIAPWHILAAIIDEPTPRMEDLLPAPEDRPLQVHECGNDLVAMATAGKLRDVPTRKPEANATVHVLAGKREKWVFLVTPHANQVRDVLAAIAHILAQGDVEDPQSFTRLLDLSSLGVSGVEALSQLDRLLREQPRGRPVLLALPTLSEDQSDDAAQWLERLAAALPDSRMRGMCGITPGISNGLIKNRAVWRGLAHILYVRDAASEEIPSEL